MVMVIDDAALRVVSALVGMYDVMEHRVTLIELLSKKRQPLPVGGSSGSSKRRRRKAQGWV